MSGASGFIGSNISDKLKRAGIPVEVLPHSELLSMEFDLDVRRKWELVGKTQGVSTFLHLAFLDHCPNVVVDARAAGCKLIVASSGGTKEIAGQNSAVVEDHDWDLSPLDLYSPPPLDYSKQKTNEIISDVDIVNVSRRYIEALESI